MSTRKAAVVTGSTSGIGLGIARALAHAGMNVTLNGFGELRAPPPTAQAIRVTDLATLEPSAEHPPGLYGPAASARAINLIEPKTVLKPLPNLPAGTSVMPYQADKARPLKPELLTVALGLLFADILAVVLLQAGLSWKRGGSAPVLLLTTPTRACG